jgi:hypothetical protein
VNENGQVDVGDLLVCMRVSLNLISPSAQQLLRCDMAPLAAGIPAPGGKITAGDLVVIQNTLIQQ